MFNIQDRTLRTIINAISLPLGMLLCFGLGDILSILMNTASPVEEDINPGPFIKGMAVACLLCFLYQIFWIFRISKDIQERRTEHGYYRINLAILVLGSLSFLIPPAYLFIF
jgi:hypothetical protein